MGIQGLLPFLKKIHTPVNLAQFEGCTVAIDAYCWLHKGAFSCAEKLALGEKTDQYVYYCMKYIDNMLKKNIKPILVFDGCHLPSKREVEKSRREKREVNRKKAAQLLREGKRAEARECLQRCIDISPEMALNLMNTCRARGVDCIVAPYEADAQLAFLNKAGIAQIIITEDSDLLLFGCEKVIFKMDHMGNGLLIEQRRLNEVLEINGAGFTFDKFRYMCILSGCDYLASLPGIGLAKACKVFKMARQDDLKLLLKKFPSTYLKMNLTVTEEYIQGFLQANNTFLHQLVYDPINRELRPLCRYPPGVDSEDFPYAGAMMSKEHALQVALGNINIYNGEKFAAFDPDQPTNKKSNNKKSPQLHLLSIWDRNYRVRPKGELKETQNIQRPNLKGKEVVVQHNALNWKKKEIVDPDTIRSNHELSTMYEEFPDEKPQVESLTDESIKQISPNTSPRRISPRNSPKRKKRRSSESDDDVKLSPVKKYRKLSQSPQKFLKSLVAANTNSPVKTEVEEEEECDKENGFVSPKRNRFAVATPTNKSRFNINAKKVVKSRFFASPPSEKSSSQDSEKNEEKSHSSMSDEPELQRTHKEDVCQSDSSTLNSSVEKTLKVKKTISDKNTKEESPGSAFNWSKLKSTKKVDSSPESSKITVKSQFKRVVLESNLKQYFSRSASKEEESEEKPKFCLGSDEDDNESQETNVSYSQQSNAYSIDSFCMGGSQTISDISESQGSDVCSRLSEIDESVDTSRKEHKDDDLDRSSQHSIPEKITRTTTFTSPVSTKKLPAKGCRVSGLSKGKRSKSLASIEDQGKQQTIKNFFSKFAHNKSQPKISINTDESDDVEITSVTPTSTDFNNRTAVNGTQRKILP